MHCNGGSHPCETSYNGRQILRRYRRGREALVGEKDIDQDAWEIIFIRPHLKKYTNTNAQIHLDGRKSIKMHGRYYSVIQHCSASFFLTSIVIKIITLTNQEDDHHEHTASLNIHHHRLLFNSQERRHYSPFCRHWLWSNLETPSCVETFFYRWSGFQQFFDFTYFLTTLAFNLLKSDQSPGWPEISLVFLSNIPHLYICILISICI